MTYTVFPTVCNYSERVYAIGINIFNFLHATQPFLNNKISPKIIYYFPDASAAKTVDTIGKLKSRTSSAAV